MEVQCSLAPVLPNFNIVGLADKAVGESKERVRAALSSMGLALPPKRIIINLSPADLPKEGLHYDLPVALAVLAAMGITEAEQLADWFMVRELALDARVAPSPGGLLAAIHASEEEKGLICPAAQGSEAKWASDVPILAAPDLASLLNHLKGTSLLPDPERGLVEEGRISPFRAPHHSASMAALTREGLKVNRAKSASHISACCSWTSSRNSSAPCSTRCASRSRRTGSISRWPPRA